jgi:hypothetical protein
MAVSKTRTRTRTRTADVTADDLEDLLALSDDGPEPDDRTEPQTEDLGHLQCFHEYDKDGICNRCQEFNPGHTSKPYATRPEKPHMPEDQYMQGLGLYRCRIGAGETCPVEYVIRVRARNRVWALKLIQRTLAWMQSGYHAGCGGFQLGHPPEAALVEHMVRFKPELVTDAMIEVEVPAPDGSDAKRPGTLSDAARIARGSDTPPTMRQGHA